MHKVSNKTLLEIAQLNLLRGILYIVLFIALFMSVPIVLIMTLSMNVMPLLWLLTGQEVSFVIEHMTSVFQNFALAPFLFSALTLAVYGAIVFLKKKVQRKSSQLKNRRIST